MRASVFNLPPFRIGPYHLRVVPRLKHQLSDRRTHREVDWNAGLILLRNDLSQESALYALLCCVVVAIHYRSGLNDTCDEEAFTHSLASGLVELAHTSPHFWFELHRLMDQMFGHEDMWSEAAGSDELTGAIPLCPERLRMGRHSATITWIPAHLWVDRYAYGLYTPGKMEIELLQSLQGSNRPLVVLHEVLHFLHEVMGLDDTCDEQTFKLKQVVGLLRLWRQNPEFWRWWLTQLEQPTKTAWASQG